MNIPIIGGLFDLGKTWLEGKNAKSKAKAEAEAKVVTLAAESIATWEQLHAKGAETSWKDEYWTVIFSIPMIMCFIPGGFEYVTAGFESLSNTPKWYQEALLVLVFASVGVRYGGKLVNGVASTITRSRNPQ